MKLTCLISLVFFVVATTACKDMTTVHIKNCDGPIYLHSPIHAFLDALNNQETASECPDYECTCVARPNCLQNSQNPTTYAVIPEIQGTDTECACVTKQSNIPFYQSTVNCVPVQGKYIDADCACASKPACLVPHSSNVNLLHVFQRDSDSGTPLSQGVSQPTGPLSCLVGSNLLSHVTNALPHLETVLHPSDCLSPFHNRKVNIDDVIYGLPQNKYGNPISNIYNNAGCY